MAKNSTTGASQTIASTVYAQLRNDILCGALRPGQRLRVETLRERYDSSASPVREALNRLSANALVTNQDNRGFCVPDVSREEMLELYKTRGWLEARAIRESIENGTVAWEEELVLAKHRLERTPRFLNVADGDAKAEVKKNPEWELVHRAFHLCLISACGSRWMIRFCEQLHDQADRYRQLAMAVAPYKRPSREEHTAIADACLEHNADLAVELLMAHYDQTRDIILIADPSVLEPPETE